MEGFIQEALFAQALSIQLVIAVFFTGLLTSLTPCVYPMVPITAGVVGRASQSKHQALLYSFCYVLGLALVYAALGVIAAASGQLFGGVASHPFTLAGLALLCSFMGAWMLGWLHVPSLTVSWNRSQSDTTPKKNILWLKGLSLFGAGALSGLVMAPCTSPVLGMLLMFVAAKNELMLGGILMFCFALGMSALLIVAGTFSGVLASLPRSGRWMNVVKWILALLMFTAASFFSLSAARAIEFESFI